MVEITFLMTAQCFQAQQPQAGDGLSSGANTPGRVASWTETRSPGGEGKLEPPAAPLGPRRARSALRAPRSALSARSGLSARSALRAPFPCAGGGGAAPGLSAGPLPCPLSPPEELYGIKLPSPRVLGVFVKPGGISLRKRALRHFRTRVQPD